MQLFNNKNQKGFMLVEVLVISAILAILVIASSAVARSAIELSKRTLNTAQANFLLEEGAEAVRILRDNNWNDVTYSGAVTNYYLNFANGAWTKTPNIISNGIFTRYFTISPVYRDNATKDIVTQGGDLDPGTVFITMNVYWDQNGKRINKSMSFYLTNIF